MSLEKYQIIRRLATGGMAELFLARVREADGSNNIVVFKRILPQHAESEDFIRMFLTEARLAATLDHPNIVKVYDIGDDRGAHFFTMEYVQGQDLRKLVRAARKQQRPIPLEHILHIIMGVAGGLNHAHSKAGPDGIPLNIVHRDVSPSNVLVTYGGDAKVVDFGIAKAATAQVTTVAGTLKGKIPYMSPEQCRGEAVDRRSDIFSIGTLLWELTTGKRLFAGSSEFAILNRVASGDVPTPSSIRPDYPPELEAIVMKALQVDPDQRYANGDDLKADLEDFAREAGLPVSSASLGAFMGQLFAQEIQATKDELIRAQDPRAPQHMGVADFGTAPPASSRTTVSPGLRSASPSMELDGYTPSELRHPGAATGAGFSPSSDLTKAGGEISLHEVPGRMRSGPLLAVGLGFFAAVAIAGGVAWSVQEEPVAAQAPATIEVIRADPPAPVIPARPPATIPQPGGSIGAPTASPAAAGDPGRLAAGAPSNGAAGPVVPTSDAKEPRSPVEAAPPTRKPKTRPKRKDRPEEGKSTTKPTSKPTTRKPTPKRPRKPKKEERPTTKLGVDDLPF